MTGPEREAPSLRLHRSAGAGSGDPEAGPAARGRLLPGLVLVLGLGAGGGLAGAWLASPWGLLQVEVPAAGATVGVGGVEVLVRFPEPARVEASTFRALLNGADVTGQLDVAANGAHGRLHGLLDGGNELRVAVFGRPWWAPWWAGWVAATPLRPLVAGGAPRGVLVEASRRIPLRYRRSPDWDRG